MKRFLISALAIGLACTTWSGAYAGCHHHRAVRVAYYAAAPMYYTAPAPVQTFHQFQTIGGPAPTQVYDSAPVYGQPITESVSAPIETVQAVQVQAAPVQTVEVQAAPVEVQAVAVVEATPAVEAAETIPVETTHPVETIDEAPVVTEAVAQVVQAAPQVQYVEAAPQVQYVEAAPQVQYVEAAPAAPTFVQTPPANRANIIETYYQPSMMYFQPAPVMMLQAVPARGCRHCRLH